MLLFFLPDGQIVLHTGDFRADPSMETYPELLGCRVQTLYLDTTLVLVSLLSCTKSTSEVNELPKRGMLVMLHCVVTLNKMLLSQCGSVFAKTCSDF